MEQVNICQAKTQLSKLVERAAAGEEIIIANAGKPRARLVPLERTTAMRRPGRGKGRTEILDGFDDPLPSELARAFGTER